MVQCVTKCTYDDTVVFLTFLQSNVLIQTTYSQTCLKRPLKRKQKEGIYKTDNHLMQVKSIAECSGEHSAKL